MVGKFSFDARRCDKLRRIGFDLSFANEKLKKRPEAGELSCNRRFLFFCRVKSCHPLADRQTIDLLYRNIITLLDL
jgi:hypothetical protein